MTITRERTDCCQHDVPFDRFCPECEEDIREENEIEENEPEDVGDDESLDEEDFDLDEELLYDEDEIIDDEDDDEVTDYWSEEGDDPDAHGHRIENDE